MLLATLVTLAGLAVVVVALYREPVPAGPPEPQRPEWWPLPLPADIQRADFPLALPGYDPARVDAHLDAVAAAFADLLAVAPPEVVQRARLRAYTRTGRDPLPFEHDAAPAPGEPRSALPAPDADAQALRTEAALAALDERRRQR